MSAFHPPDPTPIPAKDLPDWDARQRIYEHDHRSDEWERADNETRHRMIVAANKRSQRERVAEVERQARAHRAHLRRRERKQGRISRP